MTGFIKVNKHTPLFLLSLLGITPNNVMLNSTNSTDVEDSYIWVHLHVQAALSNQHAGD